MSALSQVPSVTPPDSVYYTAYTSLKPTTVNHWKKKTFAPLNTVFELLALIAWTSCARVKNFGSLIFQPPLILFSTLPVLMGEIPARPLPSLFFMMRSVQEEC